MWNTGQYHRRVPRDPRENLHFRRHVLRWAAGNKSRQKALLEACRRDLLFWVNTFVWQFNPNSIGGGSSEVGPFVTWDFQDQLLSELAECIQIRQDVLIEKSRELGASWICLLVLAWLFLFHGWKKFLVISRNQEAVDRPDDPDSLFWKLDYIFEYLPDWMIKGRVHRRKNGFKNLINQSVITGQATTGKAGVGGRCTAMFIDEFSQIEEDFEVLHRTSDTTNCRIFNGTHRGLDTAFFELSRRVDLRKIVIHWSQHPDKRKGLYRYADNKVEVLDKSYHYPPDFKFVMDGTPTGGPYPGLRSPWYDEQCKRKGSARAIAMDLDINPQGSVSQFFDPLLIRQLIESYAREPSWEGDLRYDPDLGVPFELIYRKGGPLRLWLNLVSGKPPAGMYAFGGDIAAGAGATPSCLSGANCRTGEKVAEYADPHILPEDLAPLAVALCRLFADEEGNPARLAWEIPGPGQTFGKRVCEIGFRNIYYREANPTLGGGKVSEIPGWTNNPHSKNMLLRDYNAALHSRHFLNHSEKALDECRAFKYDQKGSLVHSGEQSVQDPSGARVNHGDRVIADAIAWMLCRKVFTVQAKELRTEIQPGSLAWRRELRENRRRHANRWAG